MNRLFLIATVLALAAVPAFATFGHGTGYDGGSWDFTQVPGYFQGQGGEFRLEAIGTPGLNLNAYALATKNRGFTTSFQSFCVETTEYIYDNMHAFVSTQNAALTGPGSHAYKGSTAGGDDLDPQTAWLYTQFATGQLASYFGFSGGRAQAAGAMQRLIWSIEGEGGGTFTLPFESISLTAAQIALIGTWQSAYTASGWTGGIGAVRVLQMYNQNGDAREQDQLYLSVVPVPGAVLLGAIGLGLAGWVKRRLA
jgi:hypothetical protein